MEETRGSGEEAVYAGTLDRPRIGLGRIEVAATCRGGHSPEPSSGEDGGSGGAPLRHLNQKSRCSQNRH